jgi:uncharacterized protein with HEPN domain
MPRRLSVILDEISDAIDGIESATAGKQLEDFSRDWLLKHGVQRGLEIISEASRHLPDGLLAQAPEIPWKQVRGIGNLLRHEYHKVADKIVWAVVTDSVPQLKIAIGRIRSSLTEDD